MKHEPNCLVYKYISIYVKSDIYDNYEYRIRNKYYLNTVLNESLENELMIVLNKKYIVPEELTNIFINDSNRLVENKLVK